MIHFLAPLWALFAIGTLGFYVFLTVFTFFIIGCIESDSTKWSLFWVTLAVLLVGTHVFPLYSAKTWLLIGVGYFASGAVWSLVKWHLFVVAAAAEYAANRDERASNRVNYSPGADGGSAKENLDRINNAAEERAIRDLKDRCSANKNKHTIYMWIAYWPASILWTLTHDLVESIFNFLRDVYNRQSASALNKVLAKP